MSRPLDPDSWVCAWCHTRNPTDHPTCTACGRDLMTRPQATDTTGALE